MVVHLLLLKNSSTNTINILLKLMAPLNAVTFWWDPSSVTRLGNLLHFGKLFKAGGKNYFAQIPHILCNFCNGVKTFNFPSAINFGQLL